MLNFLLQTGVNNNNVISTNVLKIKETKMIKRHSLHTCYICNKEFANTRNLSVHIRTAHRISYKDFYDKYVKRPDEGYCHNCGKPTPFIKLSRGYLQYCSRKCANTDKESLKRRAQNNLKKYGVTYPQSLQSVKDKIRQTCQRKYGVDAPSQNKDIIAKMQQTMIDHYGVTSFTKTEEYRRKSRETSLRKYGFESPNQCPTVQKKQQETCFKHYGVLNPGCKCETIRQRREATNLKRYGTKCTIQNPQVQQKSKQTCLEKYGVPNPMQCRDIMLKNRRARKKPVYNGKKYDSSWEYKFEQYLIEHKIHFKYQPDIFFQYEYQGKYHRYFPDFAIYDNSGKLKDVIEIKGNHLMKDMLNPKTQQYQKYLCILQNNVKILQSEDLKRLGIVI